MQDLIKGELDWHNKVNANFHEFDSRIDTKSLLESTGYGVISGLEVNAQDTPNMTVKVNAGIVHMPNGVRLAPEGNSSLAINASNTTNPRIDIIYVSADSSIEYLSGTAASAPTAPILLDGAFLLYQINVPAGATTITNSNIVDKRKIKVTTEYLNNTINQHKADNAQQFNSINTTMEDIQFLNVRGCRYNG